MNTHKHSRQLALQQPRLRRGGFTLIEVLVVLAILVVLFGMLFAPMMTGMQMVTSGRVQARLQDTARLAAEQMRRELAEAMYVYPLPTILTSTGSPATDVAVTDYSQIVFVPPAADDNGNILTPRRPRIDPDSGEIQVTRYFVKPPDTTAGKPYPDETNPFVLTRQEGLYRLDPATGQYTFGSMVNGTWTPDQPITENALTLKSGYDIPATNSICLTCRKMQVGYVAVCPEPGCGGTSLAYLHRDVEFVPERITGENLTASENDSLYTARHGNWMGTPNNGTTPLSASFSKTASELQPRIVVLRWDDAQRAYRYVALDSANFPAADVQSNLKIRWNSLTGQVRVGEYRTIRISADLSAAPAAGAFWNLRMYQQDNDSPFTINPTATALAVSPIEPIWPKDPTNWGEPRMPIAYRISAGLSEGNTTLRAKVVPHSTRVTVMAGGQRIEYTQVQNGDQAELGEREYSEYLNNNDQTCEVRLNRYKPASPDAYGSGLASFDIFVTYYYRTNFNPYYPQHDDVVCADYSTGEIINITLIPQRFVTLEAYSNTAPYNLNMVVPGDLPLAGTPVRLQAVVENARR
jgi:prepilin-type N-terminal cleavage/methylation domain-containing protein